MNYCRFRNDVIKRMCNSVKPLLPPEYQQVEYLQSSGSQYLRTGVYNTTATDYYCKLKIVTINSNNYIFGAWHETGRYFVSYTSSGLQYLGYRNSAYAGGTMSTGVIYEISGTLKPGRQTLYVNGALQVNGANSSTISPAGEIYLYASNTYSASETQYYITAQIYRFTLDNNGQTALDFIPCYRKSDNKPGMYDLVTNTFFTNVGTGEFTVGNNV